MSERYVLMNVQSDLKLCGRTVSEWMEDAVAGFERVDARPDTGVTLIIRERITIVIFYLRALFSTF